MVRRIIEIDQEKCNGCGACAAACHEGAIGMINGKAALLRDDYCDGLGDCLPTCPTGAISFGCPGSAAMRFASASPAAPAAPAGVPVSRLGQWPIQIKLLPVEAPFYAGAKVLIAADCTAFSRADFHDRFMRGRITMIGCPKLDEGDYAEKLTEILRRNDIKEVTIVRMEVPCCGGLQRAAETALRQSGKFIPWQVVTLGRDGNILD